ncbi:TetR family transcriptional regulator [Prauserella marina]|uniref:DNA-binding transcriptional regulator, AcrR family n=1 Tax=Prauserella marina TaxID=530584 RepID=A0A222VR30_9PSEU|nr:TetR/AcrR family transcriptional regulator [Prauserella marina]ASR36359.1 TetR family transcriptional regulator [Prauserella marina]PWV77151.1 TetR family transcriptional regulator [Prauserella marina]SDD05613.1 DNA-binding transcriptional regulator, AcrR family [Prauserella marina]
MVRLSRAETQERNRAKVLAAARAEFAERGFREAKIDAIAERAELTRGAVYSNFPGKRALYFAVLADEAEHGAEADGEPGHDRAGALAALARAWVARFPLATDDRFEAASLGADLVPEIVAGDDIRRPFTQLLRLDAILIGLALEALEPGGERLVRTAEMALTMLHGASELASAAPGFVEPFNVVAACEKLAGLELADRWQGPPIVPKSRNCARPWAPPPAVDLLRDEPAVLTGDGVVTVLGLHRLSAVEDAVRAAPEGCRVTAAVVTGNPGELMPLARLVLAGVRGRLRQAFPARAIPEVQVVCDEKGALAAAAGVSAVSDASETAVRVSDGRIVAVAEGLGAGHAAALAGVPDSASSR